MLVKLSAIFAKTFQARDELSFRNIRGALWPALLIFPLSIILGDLRYFDLKIEVTGFQSWELMLYFLGLGWLILAFIPKKFIVPLLRLAAIISAALVPFQILTPDGPVKLALFTAFQFFNGICAASAFYIFCFVLNNVERLFGMALIQLYYGFYYTIWRAVPLVQEVGKIWGGAAIMIIYLIVVFSCRIEQKEINTESDGKGSGVPFVLGLDIIYYMIMCMINYIEWEASSVSSMAFGLGSTISVGLVIVIQFWRGHNAMYIWLLFLTLSLLGLGALLYDAKITLISGSFAYGLGDGLGYIIIYYMCAGAIRWSRSLRMFRYFCLVFFIQYFIISGIFSVAFNYIEAPNKYFAFAVVLVLSSICFMLIPLIQKKLFEADWTDGLYLRDMEQYSKHFAETEARSAKEQLNLTVREEEVLTMLLGGNSPKEIAFILKISFDTVRFHQKNLYRKLEINSIHELFSKYAVIPTEKID
ncbi:MAG: helix-turn-helix transcriptional regulator [Spirochaetaceae bacterium]|nr:helix-turn-helix transcriptional regulator [Spirochaetaceae bacterium]